MAECYMVLYVSFAGLYLASTVSTQLRGLVVVDMVVFNWSLKTSVPVCPPCCYEPVSASSPFKQSCSAGFLRGSVGKMLTTSSFQRVS